jgi:hypothetical protein
VQFVADLLQIAGDVVVCAVVSVWLIIESDGDFNCVVVGALASAFVGNVLGDVAGEFYPAGTPTGLTQDAMCMP